MNPITVARVPDGQHGWHAHDPRRVSNAADFIKALPVLRDGVTPDDQDTLVVPSHQLTYLLACHKMSRAADDQTEIELLSLISSVPSDATLTAAFALWRERGLFADDATPISSTRELRTRMESLCAGMPRDRGRSASRARASAASRAAGASQLLSRPAQQQASACTAQRHDATASLGLHRARHNCAMLQFKFIPP